MNTTNESSKNGWNIMAILASLGWPKGVEFRFPPNNLSPRQQQMFDRFGVLVSEAVGRQNIFDVEKTMVQLRNFYAFLETPQGMGMMSALRDLDDSPPSPPVQSFPIAVEPPPQQSSTTKPELRQVLGKVGRIFLVLVVFVVLIWSMKEIDPMSTTEHLREQADWKEIQVCVRAGGVPITTVEGGRKVSWKKLTNCVFPSK